MPTRAFSSQTLPLEAILLLTAFSAAPMHEPSVHVCHKSTSHFATNIYGTFRHKHPQRISPQASMALAHKLHTIGSTLTPTRCTLSAANMMHTTLLLPFGSALSLLRRPMPVPDLPARFRIF